VFAAGIPAEPISTIVSYFRRSKFTSHLKELSIEGMSNTMIPEYNYRALFPQMK
jgi:hypothetical protein